MKSFLDFGIKTISKDMSLKFKVLNNLAPRNDWCHQDSAAFNKRCCEKFYNP